MPLTFNVFTGPSQVKMKWRELYLTEGLNHKLAVTLPRGIYQGFKLIPAGVNLTVTIDADPVSGLSTLVYETADGYSLTLNAAAFNVDLTPLAGTADPVILAADADYGVGLTTYANLMVYTQAEFAALPAAEQREKIIFGEVLVPGAGLIPAANITAKGRREAWQYLAPSAQPWLPLVRNGGFEFSVAEENSPGSMAYWEVDPPANLQLVPTSTYAAHGGTRSLLTKTVGAGPHNGFLYQRYGIPCTPGNHVKVRCSKRSLQATVGGQVLFGVLFTDASGVQILPSSTVVIDTSAIDATWVDVETTFTIPATARYLYVAAFQYDAADWPWPADVLLIDDVQVWLESTPEVAPLLPLYGDKITLGDFDPTVGFAHRAATLLWDGYNPTNEGKVTLNRRDEDTAQLPPMLELMGRLALGQSPALLASDAMALLARVSAPVSMVGGVERTLLWESSSVVPLRMYGTASGGFEFTNNARWNGGQWVKDTNGVVASKLWLESGNLLWYVRDAANNAPWNDALAPRWDRMTTMDASGNLITDRQIGTGWHLQGASDDDAVVPRLLTVLNDPATSTYVLLWDSTDTSGTRPHVRLYASGNGSIVLTTNARWGSTSNPTDNKWNKDVAGTNATAMFMGCDPFGFSTVGFFHARRFNDAAWDDTEWENSPAPGAGDFPIFLPGKVWLEALPNGETPALKAHTKALGATRTLMFEFAAPAGSQGATRIYNAYVAAIPPFNGLMEITINARWDEALGQWVTDAAGPAARLAFVLETATTDPNGPAGRASLVLYTTMVMGAGTAFFEVAFQQAYLSLHSPVADPLGATTRVMELFGNNGQLMGDGAQLPVFAGVVKVVGAGTCVGGDWIGGGSTWPHLFVAGPSGFGVWPGPVPPGPIYTNVPGVILGADLVGVQALATALLGGITGFNVNVVAW